MSGAVMLNWSAFSSSSLTTGWQLTTCVTSDVSTKDQTAMRVPAPRQLGHLLGPLR